MRDETWSNAHWKSIAELHFDRSGKAQQFLSMNERAIGFFDGFDFFWSASGLCKDSAGVNWDGAAMRVFPLWTLFVEPLSNIPWGAALDFLSSTFERVHLALRYNAYINS